MIHDCSLALERGDLLEGIISQMGYEAKDIIEDILSHLFVLIVELEDIV